MLKSFPLKIKAVINSVINFIKRILGKLKSNSTNIDYPYKGDNENTSGNSFNKIKEFAKENE